MGNAAFCHSVCLIVCLHFELQSNQNNANQINKALTQWLAERKCNAGRRWHVLIIIEISNSHVALCQCCSNCYSKLSHSENLNIQQAIWRNHPALKWVFPSPFGRSFNFDQGLGASTSSSSTRRLLPLTTSNHCRHPLTHDRTPIDIRRNIFRTTRNCFIIENSCKRSPPPTDLLKLLITFGEKKHQSYFMQLIIQISNCVNVGEFDTWIATVCSIAYGHVHVRVYTVRCAFPFAHQLCMEWNGWRSPQRI